MGDSLSIDYERLADAIALRLTQDKGASIEWIHVDKAAEVIGISRNVIKGWFENHLTRGIHYQVIGHQTLINTRRLNEWLNCFGAEQTVSTPLPPAPKPKAVHKVRSPLRLPKT